MKVVGQIAGIGGVSLGVFLLLFRDIIRKIISPQLTKEQGFRLLVLISILVWSVALAGIGAWMWSNAISSTATITQKVSGDIKIEKKGDVPIGITLPKVDQSENIEEKVTKVQSNVTEDKKTVKQTLASERKRQTDSSIINVMGGTEEERSAIKSGLAELKVKTATINISKSERDDSRNVYLKITYHDNPGFTDSFNTPLDNIASLILSEISEKRRQR